MRVRPIRGLWLRSVLLVAGVIAVCGAVQVAVACPFCRMPTVTLTEHVTRADAAVLATWVSARKGPGDDFDETKYEIVHVLKGDSAELKPGAPIVRARHRAANKGDVFLLLGTAENKVLDWSSPFAIGETSLDYITRLPSPESPAEKRLPFFLKFLEFPDPLVADDAFCEIDNAPFEHIVALASNLPRERLRKWVDDLETPSTRLGLYGLLLGVCGTVDDAPLLERRFLDPTPYFRLGLDGVMSGYLLIRGTAGLDVIDRSKLVVTYESDAQGNPVLDDDGQKKLGVPFSETYAAMQAVRFMWRNGAGKIEPERLRQSMRLLLDRPNLADLAIADLARWKDWSVMDRLVKLYGVGENDIPFIKRAIVRYLIVAAKDRPADANQPAPPHVAQANRHLADLRQRDPKTVEDAERFFFLQ